MYRAPVLRNHRMGRTYSSVDAVRRLYMWPHADPKAKEATPQRITNQPLMPRGLPWDRLHVASICAMQRS
jgi:hypothetical protein